MGYIKYFMIMAFLSISIPSISEAADLSVDEDCINDGLVAELAMRERLDGNSVSSVLSEFEDVWYHNIIKLAYEDEDANLFFDAPKQHKKIIRNFSDYIEEVCQEFYDSKSESWHLIPEEDTFSIVIHDRNNFAYSLVALCYKGAVKTFTNWRMKLASDDKFQKSVRIIIDNHEEEFDPWILSINEKMIFFPEDDMSFLNKLRDADSMVIKTTDINGDVITASFNLRGGNEFIDAIEEECDSSLL